MFAPLQRLEDGLFRKSRTMGPPWGPTLRLLRYPVAIVRDWLAGELSVRAMSLAYTTLLSLVPLMVFSFSILKGLGANSDLRFILQEFFRPMGSAADELTESVLQFVTNMRGDLLGAIGLAFLAYTVISTIQKVEASFNFVWQIARPRGLARRFTEYLTVMIVGPILLAVALELLAGAEHSPVAQWLNSVAPLGWILSALGQLVPYAIVIIVFAFMYGFIPNTRVQIRPALIGGVTAGVIWALVGKAFTTLIAYSSQLVAVYSGFAIVLTTLIWVYLSWLILIIGAQLAFYVQFPQHLRYGHQTTDLTGSGRTRLSRRTKPLGCRRTRRRTRPARGGARLDPCISADGRAHRTHRRGAVCAGPRCGSDRTRRRDRGGTQLGGRCSADCGAGGCSRRSSHGGGRSRYARKARPSISQGSDQGRLSGDVRAPRPGRVSLRRWSSPRAAPIRPGCPRAYPHRRRPPRCV